MHQDEPTNQSVELLVQRQVAQVTCHEGDIREASGMRARFSHLRHV